MLIRFSIWWRMRTDLIYVNTLCESQFIVVVVVMITVVVVMIVVVIVIVIMIVVVMIMVVVVVMIVVMIVKSTWSSAEVLIASFLLFLNRLEIVGVFSVCCEFSLASKNIFDKVFEMVLIECLPHLREQLLAVMNGND